MGLAPTRNGETPERSAVAKVPVPIFSEPLSVEIQALPRRPRCHHPFPGMNPYLEQKSVWHDFHERFCPTAAEFLTVQVRPDFIVKIDEHLYIHELSDDARTSSDEATRPWRSPGRLFPPTMPSGLAN
jgi:hypothetical protein